MIDVVIPAWDEATTIARCLASVFRDADGLDLRVVVVANGCADSTAQRARACQEMAGPGHELVVLEWSALGKARALNAAAPVTRGGPVVFLDADVVLGPGALQEMVRALTAARAPLLVSPRLVTCRPSRRIARSFSLVHELLPGMTAGVVGGGCYAVNRSGRERWGAFPDVTGDDAFVRSRFEAHEQLVLEPALLTHLPEDPAELVGVVRRWRRGNIEVNRLLAGGHRPAWLRGGRLRGSVAALRSVRGAWPHLPAFAVVVARARWTRQVLPRWSRADSARPVTDGSPPGALVRPRVHVVVVTHRSRGVVAACLGSLRSRAGQVTVTVVDNASGDGTVEEVARHAAAHVVANARNVGFGAAVNQVASRVPSEYLLLLNPDVELEPDAVDHLLALALARPAAGLYGGRAHDDRGMLDPTSCLAAPDVWHYLAFASGASATRLPVLDPDSLRGWKRDDCREVPVLTGAVLLVETGLWHRLGGFDERFFLYGEDVDLCERARALGARPFFTPLARYRHSGGGSSRPAARMGLILRGKATFAHARLPLSTARFAAASLVVGAGLRAVVVGDASRVRLWKEVWRSRHQWVGGW